MTYAYDLERLRVALDKTIKAASTLYALHKVPEWMKHRLMAHVSECVSLDLTLAEHQKEILK